MSELEELATIEQELERIVMSLDGTMEERDARLRDLGIYRRYSDVFSRYVEANQHSRDDPEPLKRAAFLAWYELTEPPCFSGVGDLPDGAHERVVRLLDERASTLDPEFTWMLAYYFRIEPFAFPGLESHPGLRAVFDSADPDACFTDFSAPDRMAGRGLMGEYWLSVFASGAV